MAVEYEHIDVVIVGSGFAGATLAKKLGEAKKKVLILEAGPAVPHSREEYMENFFLTTFKSPESPYPPSHLVRDPEHTNVPRPSIPDLVLGWQQKDGKFKEDGKSYLINKAHQDGTFTPFASTYERVTGGTGNHWMGTCLRMTDSDFKLQTKYGKGLDWPISYSDLERHYIAVEKLIGVAGNAIEQQRVQHAIGGKDMRFEFPMPEIPKSHLDSLISEKLFRIVDNARGIIEPLKLHDVPGIVTSTPAGRNSRPYQNRRVCHGNTNCTPICPIQAKYDPTVALGQALETGYVEILYQHVVDYVVFDTDHKNVQDIHLVTYDDVSVPATEKIDLAKRSKLLSSILSERNERIDINTKFVLAAHAIENAKIMLNSFKKNNTGQYTPTPSDLLVGKYLMDHPVYLAWGLTKDTDDPRERAFGYRGPLSTSGIETGRDGEFRQERAAWRIEIGNEGWNWPAEDPNKTAVDFIYGINENQLNHNNQILVGKEYVRRLNDLLTRQFRVAFLVEQEANENSFVKLSENKVDNLEIPRIEVHYQISDYVKKGFESARKAAKDLFEHMGARSYHDTDVQQKKADAEDVLQFRHGTDVFHYQGAGHVCGTHVMGNDETKSVVDSYQKCHSHDNLYLVGCGSMPSIGTQNPTLTMLAITDRTGDDIINGRPKVGKS